MNENIKNFFADKKDGFKVFFFGSIVGSGFIFCFWFLWFLILKEVPVSNIVPDFIGTEIRISRWWDIFSGGILIGIILYFCQNTKPIEPKLYLKNYFFNKVNQLLIILEIVVIVESGYFAICYSITTFLIIIVVADLVFSLMRYSVRNIEPLF